MSADERDERPCCRNCGSVEFEIRGPFGICRSCRYSAYCDLIFTTRWRWLRAQRILDGEEE